MPDLSRRVYRTIPPRPPGDPRRMFFLCLRCRVGFSHRNWAQHVRDCMQIKACPGCSRPFPCSVRGRSYAGCELGQFTKRMRIAIPEELVPYLRCNSKAWKANPPPEVLAMKPAVDAWIASLKLPKE